MTTKTEETLAARISRSLADRIIAGGSSHAPRLRPYHIAEEFGASTFPAESFPTGLRLMLAEASPSGVRVAAFNQSESRNWPKCAQHLKYSLPMLPASDSRHSDAARWPRRRRQTLRMSRSW